MILSQPQFEDKKIAVLGFGVEGQSATHFLLKHNAHITIFDESPQSAFDPKLLESFTREGVIFHFGKIDDVSEFELIIRSPGVPLSHKALKNVTQKVTSVTKLFFDLCSSQIIGVTGTKGKGTTSSLIYEMLKADGKDAYIGGNIGVPALDFVDKLTHDSIVVLELSSFQLADLHKSPHIAVLLMITSDHLDYHKDIMEYVAAKRNLIAAQTDQDYAIINRDYPASRESDIHTAAKIFQVSRETEPEEGSFIKNKALWVRLNGVEGKIVELDEIKLPGAHNYENVGSAVMAALLIGVSKKSIVSVLKTFKGLEHRLELVREIDHVQYYDDSFSTTPETAVAAIEAFDQPKILILGGSSKDSDFTHLGEKISESHSIKAIIGIGEEWGRIKSEIRNPKFEIIEGCKNMEEIVKKAAEIAEVGDVVLLSPACASFGMFKNYKERGNQFKDEVKKLKNH